MTTYQWIAPPYRRLGEYYHLAALLALAVAQPLFEILGRGPEFFVVRESERIDIPLLVLCLLFVLPGLLSLTLELVGLAGSRVRAAFRTLFFFLLITALLLPLWSRGIQGGWRALCAASLSGMLLALVLEKLALARSFLNVLGIALLLAPATLLSKREIREFIFPPEISQGKSLSQSSTPVVMVLFDEFSQHSLLDKDLQVDARRFPNFAALSKQSHWFRNATGVSQFTPIAVSAVLSGRFPNPRRMLPILANYPGNVFTLLAKSHAPYVHEPITKLCPIAVCGRYNDRLALVPRMKYLGADLAAVYLNYLVPPDLQGDLPQISGQWQDFWGIKERQWQKAKFSRPRRVLDYLRWVGQLKVSDRPPFFFVHILLPHMPYQFMPSGRAYNEDGPVHGYVHDRWEEGDVVAQQKGFHRYFNQVGTADKLLGILVERLKKLDLYDRALLVVTADHGVSFQPGTYRRGHPKHPAFFEDIMSVPLFIKKPFQKEGTQSMSNVESIDIVPSIADVLGAAIDWPVDGSSVFQDSSRRAEKKLMLGQIPAITEKAMLALGNPGEFVTYPVPVTFPRSSLDWKLGLPGYNASVEGRPFYIGMHSELVGKPVSAFTSTAAVARLTSTGRWRFNEGKLQQVYEPKSWMVPARIVGSLKFQEQPKEVPQIAIALNGVVEGFTLTSPSSRPLQYDFEFLAPESAFRTGVNVLELFEVQESGETVKLGQLVLSPPA